MKILIIGGAGYIGKTIKYKQAHTIQKPVKIDFRTKMETSRKKDTALKIMAYPYIHKRVFQIVKKRAKKNAKILVLGSGAGSFEKRLMDNGYFNITSSDINSNAFMLKKKVNFVKVDFNKEDFTKNFKEKFDLILCIEVIEHVYSPFNLLKGIQKLMKPNAMLILTTPNVQNNFSRINFLLLGSPTLFISKPYKYGHVSPILMNILEHYLSLLNLRVIKRVPAGFYPLTIKVYSLKAFIWHTVSLLIFTLLFPLLLLTHFLQKNIENGVSSIFLIKQKAVNLNCSAMPKSLMCGSVIGGNYE